MLPTIDAFISLAHVMLRHGHVDYAMRALRFALALANQRHERKQAARILRALSYLRRV